MRRACATALCVLLILWTASASADEVILKDGRKFAGEVLKETDEAVIIKTVGGTLEFKRVEVAQVIWKTDPRKLYEQRAAALNAKSVNARLELARWCLAQGLPEEARKELEQVLLLAPQNYDAQTLLGQIAKGSGQNVSLRIEVTLTDGSQVKGRLVNTLFTFETAYGVLHIPTGTVSSVVMGDGKTPDEIATQNFKAKGQLTEELLVVDSKLGRLTIAKKDVRELAIYQPTAEELAEIKFNDTLRECNHFGLDVMLVVDSTDSMEGILLRLRQQGVKVCETVRRFIPNVQFGLVSYRDLKEFDPAEFTYVTKLSTVTGKVEDFLKALGELRGAGGGDIPDSVFEGLSEAMTHGGWRPGSHRVIVLIGDAPPHPQNNGIKKTLQLVRDWRNNTQGIVHVVDTTGYNRLLDEFKSIAEAGGGQTVILNDEKLIGRELVPLILGVEWRDRFLKAFDEGTKPDAEGGGGQKPKPDEDEIIKG
jgi:tetratricopeptide (TPR) repeat protein